MSDGEVEETVSGITHFQGANLWELTLSGGVVRTANISSVAPTVVPMTNEPTGVAWNPGNGHYYFSDDDDLKVFDLNPGADGLVGTADDSWTSFSTRVRGMRIRRESPTIRCTIGCSLSTATTGRSTSTQRLARWSANLMSSIMA